MTAITSHSRRSNGSRDVRTAVRVALGFVVASALLVAPGAVAQTAVATRNLLWKAARGEAIVYLVGSVHLLTEDYYPLSPALEAAFKESDLLVEEVDLAEMLAPDAQFQTLRRGMLPGDQSLDKVVSPSTYAQVSRRLASIGIPIEPLKRFKPWLLTLTLLGFEWQAAGFDPALGLDKHFYDRARAEGKPVQGLETVEFQISRFDEMTMDEQDRMLAATLKELDTQKAAITELARAWKTGDAGAIERIMLRDLKQEPLLYQRLVVDRNRLWLPKIDALLARRGRTLLVVGAAHMVGPDGLVALLRARGYAVEQQ